jgi:hypothetical protein
MAKGHVVAKNLHFRSVFNQLGKRVVREGGFVLVIQLDVVECDR